MTTDELYEKVKNALDMEFIEALRIVYAIADENKFITMEDEPPDFVEAEKEQQKALDILLIYLQSNETIR